MLIIKRLPELQSHESLGQRERDTIAMTFEERRWLRRRANTNGGREIALALPTGTRLKPGTIIAIEPEWFLQVEASPEPVLAIYPDCQETAVRVAFEVGNHHFPLAIDGTRLLVPDDSAMRQLLIRLSVAWERCQTIFEPAGLGHNHDD
jgi:urease accessory protein